MCGHYWLAWGCGDLRELSVGITAYKISFILIKKKGPTAVEKEKYKRHIRNLNNMF